MAEEVSALTHQFRVTERSEKSYITAGYDSDGQLTRVFIVIHSTEDVIVQGLLSIYADVLNRMLKSGQTVEEGLNAIEGHTAEFGGLTDTNANLADSIRTINHVSQWIREKFLTPEGREAMRRLAENVVKEEQAATPMINHEEPPPCTTCESIMVRSGAQYKCPHCGAVLDPMLEAMREMDGH